MDKRTLYTWVVLLVFTVLSGIVSGTAKKYAFIAILGFSAIKFMGVAFEFMHLKVAHPFWKIAVMVYLFVFFGIVLILI